jgi:sulfoxide reductase heme-binding subunit YedZ
VLSQSSYWVKRVIRHLALALATIAIVYCVCLATPSDPRHQLSIGTAYASMAFLAASLSLGAWKLLRRQPNPVSFDLRRDFGIWAGLLAILHTAIGLTVHLRGRMWMYFFKQLQPLKLQNTQFGLANYTGLAAALLFLMLVAISNDLSLRTLGTRVWKSLQRWTYLAVALTVLHGILFQLIEKRQIAWVLIFAVLMLIVAAMQLTGYLATKRIAKRKRDEALTRSR